MNETPSSSSLPEKPKGGSRHYKHTEIEPIDVIEDWGLNFNLGNVIKYVARAQYHENERDLTKALWYLQREIWRISRETTPDRGGSETDSARPGSGDHRPELSGDAEAVPKV